MMNNDRTMSGPPHDGWRDESYKPDVVDTHVAIMKATKMAIDVRYSQPDHYKLPIQPLEYIVANNLDFLEGNIIKYVSRYKAKNGVDDLRKALDYLQHLIKRESSE